MRYSLDGVVCISDLACFIPLGISKNCNLLAEDGGPIVSEGPHLAGSQYLAHLRAQRSKEKGCVFLSSPEARKTCTEYLRTNKRSKTYNDYTQHCASLNQRFAVLGGGLKPGGGYTTAFHIWVAGLKLGSTPRHLIINPSQSSIHHQPNTKTQSVAIGFFPHSFLK